MIIVASVSCIYGLGNPEEYYNLHISLREGDMVDRDEVISRLIDIQYNIIGNSLTNTLSLNELSLILKIFYCNFSVDFKRSTFRVKGDTLDIFPASQSELAIKVQFFGDEVEKR